MKLRWLAKLFGTKPHSTALQPLKLILTQSCLEALQVALTPSRQMQHEGIAYLLGRTDGTVTLATTVFAPAAHTTRGSFHVEPRAMAACMQAAAEYELQIVAQVHTHPGEAYHSDGDVEGAKIRYPGYASVHMPNYGIHLPSFSGAAAYLWKNDLGWLELADDDVIIVPGAGPWTNTTGIKS